MKPGNRSILSIVLIVVFTIMVVEGFRMLLPFFNIPAFSTTQWITGLAYIIALFVILAFICKFSMNPLPAKEVKIKTKSRIIKVKYKPGFMERFSDFCDKNFYK